MAETEPVKPTERSLGFGTRALHADDVVAIREAGIAPAIGVATTFRRPEPDSLSSPFDLGELGESNPSWHVYSRYTSPNLTRVEAVLSNLLGGCALTFGSGLAAIHAALMHLTPPAIAITAGYAGTHATIELYCRGRDVKLIGLDDEYPPGTLCWCETPTNPTGEVRDIARSTSRAVSTYSNRRMLINDADAAKAHAVGGKLVVDSTFAPPPLQDPLAHGADIVMHSATKYLAGHSDVLMGVLVVRTAEEWQRLIDVRKYGGAVPGSLEAWLLLRSLRTLEVRVERQARTATDLALWLDAIAQAGDAGHDGVSGGVLARCHHAVLQKESFGQISYGPATFAIVLVNEQQATRLPHALRLFAPATSLGGVESLIEQRLQTDPKADPRLIRLSIGLESLADLQADLRDGLNLVRSNQASGSSQA